MKYVRLCLLTNDWKEKLSKNIFTSYFFGGINDTNLLYSLFFIIYFTFFVVRSLFLMVTKRLCKKMCSRNHNLLELSLYKSHCLSTFIALLHPDQISTISTIVVSRHFTCSPTQRNFYFFILRLRSNTGTRLTLVISVSTEVELVWYTALEGSTTWQCKKIFESWSLYFRCA